MFPAYTVLMKKAARLTRGGSTIWVQSVIT